ncbi:MAG TPA: peptidase M20, partial [Thermoanaerobacterales bacterium]|nr:peptidase M20 [Thermoanaerobacterales bacterium]
MDRQEIIDYFLELVTISSPSKDERKIADKLKYDLIQQGFAVEEDNSAYNVDGNTGNIIARLKGNTEKPT